MEDRKVYIKKGILLGLILLAVQKIISGYLETQMLSLMFSHASNNSGQTLIIAAVITLISFAVIIGLFLINDKIRDSIIVGVYGLVTLIIFEIFLWISGLQIKFAEYLMSIHINENGIGTIFSVWLIVYAVAVLGAILGTSAGLIMTDRKVRWLTPILIDKNSNGKEISMENSKKIKLLLYGLITAITFTYFLLPERAAISVPIFALVQFVCLWFIVPERKRLWLFAPIFLISINSFISSNQMFSIYNFVVILVLYIVMFSKIDFIDTSSKFIFNIIHKFFQPFNFLFIPFQWLKESNVKKADTAKRVIIGLLIAIPSALVLIALLSNADQIFSKGAANLLKDILNFISFNAIFKILYGLLAGLYLLALVYSSYIKKTPSEEKATKAKSADLLILNIFLISILAVYTIFVFIQFRYLFAGAKLPYGLNYTEYARRGFFELFGLTGINIILILATVHSTKNLQTLWGKITKWLSCYLCAITLVLLASSFYRMMLYNNADGLTRLRYMVFGFLIFEAVGLLITFIYIFKPKFNIVAVYLSIALLYYVLLNVVLMDNYIAKSQVDRFLNGDTSGIYYALTLSPDAASQIKRLISTPQINDTHTKKVDGYISFDDSPTPANMEKQALAYIRYHYGIYKNSPSTWQRYNLSYENVKEIYGWMYK